MAKDKIVKELNKDIYALDLQFEDEIEMQQADIEQEISEDEIDFVPKVLKECEETEEEMPKKKKVLSKIEEGIKSSKIGAKKTDKTKKTQKATTDKIPKKRGRKPKSELEKKSEIKMHTENNITEIKLNQNEYKIELQRNEYNIYTEINETSYIIVREPSLRIVCGGFYLFMERQDDDYSVTTNQDFKINYVIDNLERKNNTVNFKLTNLTQIEADEDGLIFEIDEEKVVENNLEDNKTLVISEEDGRVYLPYTKDEIKEEMLQNKGSKISELIENKYILPLDKYKNSMKARFREGYNLMYKKEGKSRKASFLLGLELMFETNLHPAIISACKNLEELDIYLDCLEDNELEKFSCFKIVYKSLPTIRKAKKMKEF